MALNLCPLFSVDAIAGSNRELREERLAGVKPWGGGGSRGMNKKDPF